MKKHLLLNQLFGTVGSPNQTDETLTRENRIGLMSYLHRTLMLLLVAYIGIGNVWGTEYALVSNPTGTPALTTNFRYGNLTLNKSTAATIDGIAFKKGIGFGSTLSSISGKEAGDNNIMYDVKTTSTKFTVYVAGATGTLYFSTIAEGATKTTVENKTISSNPQKIEFTLSSTTNTCVGFSVSSTSMYIYQIIAEETGTAHKQAGEAGYQLNLDKGRYAGNKASSNSGKSGSIDNIELATYDKIVCTSSTAIQLEKNSADTYVKFTTGASAVNLKVTFSAGSLIVNTTKSTSGGTSLTSNTAQALAASTTYWIISTHVSNRASITKIAFEAASGVTNPSFSPATGSSLVKSSGTVTLTSAGNTVYYKWSQTNNQYASGDGATLAGAADDSGTSPVNATAPSTTGTWYLYAVAKNGGDYSDVVKATYTITNPTHTLTWALDGGTATGGTAAGAVEEGATLTAPTVTKVGYDFAGWSPAVPSTMPSSDATYTATWTKVYASGTYQFDGHLTVGTSPSYTVSITASDYAAKRADNIFFSATNIQFEGTDGTPDGDGDNFKGWKVKASTTIKFFVEDNSDVEVSIGSIGGGTCTITYTDQSSVVHNNTAISAGSQPSYEVKAGTMVTISMAPSSGKSITLKRIAISGTSSCTAPSSVTVAPTTGEGNYGWRYSTGETIDLTCTATGGSGGSYTYQWQKYIGTSWTDIDGATSARFQKTNCTSSDGGSYRCVVSTGEGCSKGSDEALGHGYWVRVFTFNGNYSGSGFTENKITWTGENTGTATVTLNANSTYEFKIYDNDTRTFGNPGSMYEDETTPWGFGTSDGNCKLYTGPVAGQYTFTLDVQHAGDVSSAYVNVSVMYPRRTFYLNTGGTTYWEKDGVTKFGIYYFRQDDGSGWSDLMTAYSCGNNIYYTEIPAWKDMKIDAVRLKDGATNSNKSDWWSSYKHNQTNDCPVTSNDYITITGWEEADYTYTTFSIPTYTISFAGGSGSSGSMSSIGSIACDADQALTANSFEKTGYNFSCWHADVDVKVNGATVTAGSDIANSATIQNIRSNIALTAQWTAKTTSVTLNPNTENHGTGSNVVVTATYGSALPSFSAAVPASGYVLTGYFTDKTSGTKVINSDGAFSTNSGIWNRTDGATLTLYAQYEAGSYTINLDKQVASNTPTGSVSATYGSAMPSIATLPSHANYTFGGFYTAVAGGGTCYYNGSGTSQRSSDFTSASTLYAKFTQSITVDDNGGSSDGTVTVLYNATSATVTTAPVYADHTIYKYMSPDGGTNVLNPNGSFCAENVTDGSSYVYISSSKWAATGATALKAYWKCDAPTISCTNNVVTMSVPSGATVYYTYTTDGSDPADPTSSSTEYDPSSKPTITEDTKFKAIAIQDGCVNSDIASATCTYEALCPTGGDIFTLKMTYSGDEVSVAANTVMDWSASYGTKDGGDVKFGNVNSSSNGKIKIQTGQINLNSNDGYIKLILDCPLKKNDVLSFTSSGNYELSFTTSATYSSSVKSSSKKWTVPNSFNDVSTIYIWRASSNTNNIYTINIVRPVTVTFDKNGGSSVSPTSATYDGTSSSVLATPVRADYHLVGWNTKADGSGTDLGLPGETYHLDDVTTSTTTVYAKWTAKSCASGTIYQFTVNTGLSNDNFPKTTLVYVKTSDYLATMTGGYLKAYNSGSDKLKITDNKYICINNSDSYLLVQLDCPLQVGDQIKSTVKSQTLYITKGSDSRASTYSLPVADNNVQTIPAAWAGATEIRIWAGSSNGGKIQDFQIIRTASTYNVTYNGNGNTGGDVPEDDTDYDYNDEVTVKSNSGSLAKTNYDALAYWNTKNDGTGTDFAIGSGTFNIQADTTLYAKWTQAVTLDKNEGTTAGSATAVWNAKGLTSFTAVVPASGMKCTGYYTTASGEGTKVLNSDGTYASSSVTDYVTSGKWSRTGAAPTLYARYESGGSLTWNLSVNTDAESLTTSSKSSAFTEVAVSNMTDAALEDLTYEKSKKSNLTGTISTPASIDDGDYTYVTFVVASGYKFIPSKITVKAQPVSTAKYVKLVLSDGEREISYTSSSLAAGSIATVVKENADASKYMEGTVTLKIYCYGATDKYRLGTPITIDGSIEASCATMPSYSSMSYEQTEYAVDEEASAISIVGGTNINTYAWKQNTVNDRSGGTAASGTNNTASYTPPTSSEGTMYYWCEMTNTSCDITIQSAAVGITVSAEKTDATVTWTNPASTPNYGGGGYTIKATVNETGWNGNASDLTITAPTGITIYNVTSGTTDSKKWVQVNFDVTTSFNRETYESSIPFTVSAAATATYNAISDENDVTYTSCSGGGEGTADIPVLSATHDEGSGNAPRYWWETTGNGRLFALNYGKSDCASTSDATLTLEGFSYVANSTNQRVLFQPYVAGVTKIRVYVKAATNGLKISSIGSKSSWQDQSSKYSDLAIDTIIYSNGKTSGLDNNDKGYMEVEFSSALTANNYYLITFNSSSVYMYGVKLYSSSAGSGGSLTTTLSWSPTLSDGATVDKTQSSANFTYTASPTGANNNTLGSITYTSSNTSCATVNATTGEVTITASGSSDLTTTITATLSASGCYKGKTITYIISVPGVSCTIEHGTLTSDVTSKCSTADATLTLTGFESGATVQWYKGESTISDGSTYHITTVGTTSTMVTKEAGTYSVMVTNATCSDRSNSVTISNISASASVTKIVDSWYVKNGRLTPDIALWSLSEGATLKSVAWSPSNATGLACVERDGIIYLEGKEPNTNSSSDVAYTLTATITDACGGDHVESTKTITITHQKNTDKHVLAFVVTGTEKGDFTAGVPASQTTSVDLYNAIAANFDVQATNIYSTDDEKALKEYYSQFDILCITDYPNTGTKGVNKKSYVDAIGSLIDIRPILTMEAYVAKLDNWAAKGVKGTPNSPCPRQYSMDLQCKDHEIFSGTNLVKVGEGDETMYRVTMVDKSKADYSTKDAETECSKAYDAGGYPALQGFTIGDIDEEMLPLGLIYDGETPLQVGIERQHEMSARLMVLGIQQKAMERLTTDGQTVVINALKYLMKKNEEEIADCSIAFVGGDDTKPNDWNTDANWKGGVKPDKTTREIRILAPVIITTGQKIHAMAPIKIASSGTYNDGTDEANGKITINAGGALQVDGKIQAVTAPSYSKARATSAGDIHIKASSTAQGALIFDNEDGETNATVEMYSASYWEVVDGKKKKYWSYVALPIQSGTVGEYFYNGFSYLYDETAGWIKKGMYTELHAFEGLGISMQSGNMEYFHGALAPTTTQEITLTHGNTGENLIGNSWTAPIQIANFDASDFGDATATVSIYSTGRDDVLHNPTYVTATVENDGAVSAGQWVSIPIGLPGTTGYDGLSVIPAMQAFQVNTTTETTLTLDYDKLVRDVTMATDNLTEKQHSPVRRTVKKELDALMRVRMSGTTTRTDVWLLEDSRFSDEFDNGWEATYVECDNRSPQFYANSEIGKMAFLAKSDIEGTILGLAPSRDGNEYLFTFHYVGDDEFYLNDLKLQKSVLISEENNYPFFFEDGDTNRFYISRTRIDAPAITTGCETVETKASVVRKVIVNDHVYIIRNGHVYSAQGALVK